MKVAVIGVPSALGAPTAGPEEGPDAIRRAGLMDRLHQIEPTAIDLGNIQIDALDLAGEPALRGIDRLAALTRAKVRAARKAGTFPIILGGEHSVALGSIAGAAGDHPNLGVIWIDAHPDFNTPETSET